MTNDVNGHVTGGVTGVTGVTDVLVSCLFCKIVAGLVPSRRVYQDDEFYAFHDIHPSAPVHFLLIPKLHIPSMAQLTDDHAAMMGRMEAAAGD